MNNPTSSRGNGNARGRATVRAIEAAAVRLAVEHGAAAVTVDQICAEAGIKQRTFFNHFDTKEDALLGWDLPRINEVRTREYLSNRDVGVLSGALELVDMPPTSDGAALLSARMKILAASPALAERQARRLRPLADEIRSIVRLKLGDLGPEETPARLDSSAALITQMAAALMLRPKAPDTESPVSLDELKWVWPRLI